MAKPPIGDFLRDCTTRDDTFTGLDPDQLYGLYVSWCALGQRRPVTDVTFRTELARLNIHPAIVSDRLVYPGLAMIGPAATDYIVHSSPDPLDEGGIPA
ncbi:hypothetical protein [Arthrobacter sp. M4]|uniref:hypothetical protein n=1 Tax=Arthrobacter sp. M4 TaxID=218160 RepID=UPI001CDD6988|nr:hypothetical protein [Arthrobacter sp. M4]MCA4135175.1 hypothetical protein [Arthrobacter sp. M4]